MPRVKRTTIGDFNPPVDATRQDVVNAIMSTELAIQDGLDILDVRLERIDREQELILGEEMEDV